MLELRGFNPLFQTRESQTSEVTMLRTTKERELDRTFSKIENWDEFLERWNAIDTEEEAVGLLHSSTTVPPFNSDYCYEGKRSEILKRTEFYLNVSNFVNNGAVARTAGQMVIKGILKNVSAYSLGYPENLEAALKILSFLANPPEYLHNPPYPRFVSQFLLGLADEWSGRVSPDYSHSRACKALRASGSDTLIARCLCVWGLAFKLAGAQSPEIHKVMLDFLNEEGYDYKRIMNQFHRHDEPLSEVRVGSETERVLRTAKIYVYSLWCGPGITLKR